LSTKDPAAVDTEEAVVEEEPEEQTKTLDEYLASKKQAAASALPEPRKPNEGSDDAKWKDAVALEKPEEEDFFGGKVKRKIF
jgi:plasminogen activator inhibitor 1 RNA-binding protein